MFVSSPAIVLNRIRHNDTTFITNLYTEKMGCVAFAVKKAQTAKARASATLLQPLNSVTAEWEHRGNKTLQHISDLQILHPYTTLPYQPQKSITASLLSEILYYSTRQERQGDLYPFIRDSLLWFDKAESHYDNFHITFLLSLICHLGFQPNIDNPGAYSFFDLQNAEYTPAQPYHNYFLHHADARYIPIFMNLRYTNMHLLRTTHQQRYRALKIILAYYKLHITDFPDIKSLEIVKQVLDD